MSMLAFPKQTMEGASTNTSHGLLAPPPLHTMARSKTGRKPQRSSPLAGPAVSVSDGEDAPSLLRTSSSPNLNPPESRPIVSSGLTRPKSMYSTLSLHPQSFSPPDRSRQPGNKQPIRPMSAVLSTSTTRIHLSDQYLSRPHTAGDFRSLDEQTCSRYSQFPPFTSEHLSSTTQLRPPTIMLNEEAIEAPQIPIPPLARSTSRITETTIPRDNSWYVTSAYEETPRFSRLGLAADSVVMPVSAKKFKKVQQSSGNRGSCESTTSMNSSDKPATRQSLLIGSLTSTLKFTRSHIRTPSEHQSAQEPSPTSSLSSQASSTDSDSSPSATSTLSPVSNLSRTNSFTDSSSTYTFFTPDAVTSSSRTSINEDEETIQKSLPTLPLNLETTSIISPAVNKDEKPRRGGTFKRFIRLFILQ